MTENVARLIASGPGSPAGQEIRLLDSVTTLGRAPGCQVVIDNNFASRRHAQIVRRDNLYWLRDLGSKNGTLLDNEPVTGEAPLADGAEIRIGETVFRFVDPAATQTYPSLAGTATVLRVEATTRDVWLHGQKLVPPLSIKQFELLYYLFQRSGQVVSKDELAAAVWPETGAETIYDYQVDKMVSRVRERIGKEWIETVWGYGYRLRHE